MNELRLLLTDTMELFRIAAIAPNSELALILWKMENASKLEMHYARNVNKHWSGIYFGVFESQYEQLGYFGYAPLDFD